MQYYQEAIILGSAGSIYFLIDKLTQKYFINKLNANYHTIGRISLRMLLIMIIAMTLMSEAGLDINALLTSFGITGLAISLASREVLSNLISGLALQLQRPYKVGDLITVKGHHGKVSEINLRFTILDTEGKTILVPNRIMLSDPIIIED